MFKFLILFCKSRILKEVNQNSKIKILKEVSQSLTVAV